MPRHSLVLLLLGLLVTRGFADKGPIYDSSSLYATGFYGTYPNDTFYSSHLVPPRIHVLAEDPSCTDDGLYTFFTPRGAFVPEHGRGPMIMDGKGTLIWAKTGFENVYNLQVQQWKGESYLSFWDGDNRVLGHGEGVYYLYDSAYNVAKKIDAGRGFHGDLHEFTINDDGTALMTVYAIVQHDLRGLNGTEDGYIYNSYFQEIDLETDEVLFQWDALQSYDVTDSYRTVSGIAGGKEEAPHDWFHINSIAKDAKGNYLVSGRYTHSLTYIDGRTGETIWIMGGKLNDFSDISVGQNATSFSAQHDARWVEEGTELTLFDNAADWDWHYAPYSRGLHLRIDAERMTVDVVKEYVNPHKYLATSQGSMQYMPERNRTLVGWGIRAAWTEFDSVTGETLCDVVWQPVEQWLLKGTAQSYRTQKYAWVGRPAAPPDVVAFTEDDGLAVHVSWNGATEVKEWRVYDATNGKTDLLKQAPKDGFETSILIPPDELNGQTVYQVLVEALDKDGQVLGISEPAWTLSWWRRQSFIIHIFTYAVFFCGVVALTYAIGRGVVRIAPYIHLALRALYQWIRAAKSLMGDKFDGLEEAGLMSDSSNEFSLAHDEDDDTDEEYSHELKIRPNIQNGGA